MKTNKIIKINTILFLLLTLIITIIKTPFKIDKIVNSFQFPEFTIPFLQFIINLTGVIPITIVIILLFYIVRKNKKKIKTLLLIPLAIVAKNLIKLITQRARPNSEDLLSFPSGHTTVTTTLAIVVYLIIIKDIKNKAIKKILTILIILLPILVAISRLALNQHWLTDVIGGFLLGMSVSLIGYSYISKKI
tara:strand:+ start:242 stop:814 length:573 start_codon:yes stop_codon:yes gene_type:complete